MNRRVAGSIAVVGLLVMAGAPSAIAQSKNPCATKNPGATKGAKPGSAKSPCAAKNPCAAKIPMGGPGFVKSKESAEMYLLGRGTIEERLRSFQGP